MKLIIFLLCVNLVSVLGSSLYSQNTKMNLDVNDVTIQTALNMLEEQSEYYFLYSSKMIDVNRKVDIQAADKSIDLILDDMFKDTNIKYAVKDKQIMLFNSNLNTGFISQQTIVTGKITDNQTGQPMPGVNIVVKGTTVGTISDVNGNYSLQVTERNATLVFSFVGYVIQEVELGGRNSVNVSLVNEVLGLEEVVVVGYGTQKRVNLTGSIAALDYNEALSSRPITNASQALEGKLTGLWVNQSSGLPGNDVAQIRVRGWGTLGNANALVLIDGVEGSMSDVVPQNIESITVLKDAASSAIYGSKAANGVILITTKMGRYNEKTQIEVSTYAGISSLGRRYEWAHENSAEHMTLWNQALINQGADPLFPDQLINDFKTNTNDPYKYPNTDWYDYVFRNAGMTETNISVSGGSEKNRFNLNGNYLNQDGIMVNTSSKRYSISLSLEQQVKSWLRIGGRLTGTRMDRKSPSVRDVMYWFANGAYSWIAPYTRDGRLGAGQDIDPITGKNWTNNRNVLIYTEQTKLIGDNIYFKLNPYADFILTDYLTLTSSFSSQQNSTINSTFNQIVRGYRDDGVEQAIHGGQPRLYASRSSSTSDYYSWYNTLNFNKTFADLHNVSAIAGMQLESTTLKSSSAQRSDPPKSGLDQVNAGTAITAASGSQSDLRMLSYFGRINYVLSEKYLFEMNVRADASSRFKEGNRWGIFPGFSVGWRLGEEEFIKNLNTFSTLKLRASWGQLGNQNIGSYWPYLPVIAQSNDLSYNFNDQFSSGAAITSLVDENITWETTTTLDAGFEIGILNDRLLLTADYFSKITDDIIVQLPIPSLMGSVSPPNENVGQMKNKGFEAAIKYIGEGYGHRDRFGYSLSANLTYVKNRVTKFREGAPDQLYLIREGYSYRTLYGWKWIGVYQTDQEAQEHLWDNGFIPKAGQMKLLDVNKDGRIDHSDKMPLGNTIPTYMFGADLSFAYKGFDLAILLQGIADVNIATMNSWIRPFAVSGGKATKRWENAWTPNNTDTDIPALRINDSWDQQSACSFWTQNISFLKVRNITLGYTFPETFINRTGLQDLYLYMNAQNYITFINKDYEGFDPEAGNTGGTGTGEAGSTFDNRENPYPIPRILSVGLKFKF